MQKLQKLIEKQLKGQESSCLLDQIIIITQKFAGLVEAHQKMDAVFKELDMGGIWLECPDCNSPVLLNSIHCPYCDENLVDDDADKSKLIDTPSKEKSKKKKKVKPDPKVVEEEEDDETPESPNPLDADIDEVEEDPSDDDDDESYPSEKEINKMRVAGLTKVIEDYELDVDPKDYKKTKDLRKAVNDAIDAESEDDDDGAEAPTPVPPKSSDPDEGEEAEEDSDSEEASDDEVDDFDLDDFEDEEEDDDVFED